MRLIPNNLREDDFTSEIIDEGPVLVKALHLISALKTLPCWSGQAGHCCDGGGTGSIVAAGGRHQTCGAMEH